MITMKKTGILLLSALLLCGCGGQNETQKEEDPGKDLAGDPAELYSEQVSNRNKAGSLSYSVRCDYTFRFADDTMSSYMMDGILETDLSDSTAHMSQHILANGMNSSMEGYYYDGRLYNEYNGITYYEDMKLSDMKEAMLVPLDAYDFPKSILESVTAKETDDGSHVYTIVLKEENRKDFFESRYDFYGVTGMDEAEVTDGKITVAFDSEGYFLSEDAEFTTSFTYSGSPIEAVYTSSVTCFGINGTEISITNEMKKAHKEYVAFEDIDTSQIADESDYDDSPEATAAETFRKRLIGRLGYEEIEGGAVQMKFNDNEAYTVDIANRTFIYSNYSINYTYSWQGDLISMGKCTYEFETGRTGSECQESTVEKMKDVRNYLMMELYYCGLSLDDLQAETN